MKRISVLFSFMLLGISCFAYPVGSKENIDGSTLGWSESERVWRPVAVDSTGAMQTSAGGTIIASISVDTSDISGSLIASPSQPANTAANILNRIASDSRNLELLNTAVTDDNGKLIQAIGAVKSAVDDKVIPTTDLSTTNGKIDSVVTAIGNIPTTDLTVTNGKIDSVVTAIGNIPTTDLTTTNGKIDNVVTAIGNIPTTDLTTISAEIASMASDVEEIKYSIRVADSVTMSKLNIVGLASETVIAPPTSSRKFIELRADDEDDVFYISFNPNVPLNDCRPCRGRFMLECNQTTIYVKAVDNITLFKTEGMRAN